MAIAQRILLTLSLLFSFIVKGDFVTTCPYSGGTTVCSGSCCPGSSLLSSTLACCGSLSFGNAFNSANNVATAVSSGLSTVIIVVIVVSVVIFLAVIGCIICCCCGVCAACKKSSPSGGAVIVPVPQPTGIAANP